MPPACELFGKARCCGPLALATLALGLVAAVPARSDDAAVVRNLKYFCQNLNQGGSDPYDVSLLRCQTLREDPEIFQLALPDQIPDMCQSIQDQCRVAKSDVRKSLLSNYLTNLSCAARGYSCLSQSAARSSLCDEGDINRVVDGIDRIERAGAVVSRSLKRAVKVYAEACAINRATEKALVNVNTELRAFYNDKYIGCLQAGFEGTANECTAKIDRLWQANAVRAMFDWTNSHSIVSQTTLDAVRRWTGLE